MAMAAVCDVFRTAKDVKPYVVAVIQLHDDKPGVPVNFAQMSHALKDWGTLGGSWNKDLCPAGLKRLLAKIERGTRPPAKREKSA